MVVRQNTHAYLLHTITQHAQPPCALGKSTTTAERHTQEGKTYTERHGAPDACVYMATTAVHHGAAAGHI